MKYCLVYTLFLVGFVSNGMAQVVVDFEASVALGKGPLAVTFSDQTTTGGGTISAWRWEFGDGDSSTQMQPSHSYLLPGNYTVRLTVTIDGSEYALAKPRCINVVDLSSPASGALDLAGATVVVNPGGLPNAEGKATEILIDEVQARTGIAWSSTTSMPETGTVIAITSSRGGGDPDEGYTLFTEANGARTVVWVLGNDPRGAMYGAGALLRSLEWRANVAALPGPLNITTAPTYPLRGHQLGYRNLPNTYDAWDAATYEQYIRELIVFGTNAIENVFQDDPSPHFPVSATQMHLNLSGICAAYDIDYWLWTPVALVPANAASELAKNEALFQQLPRLDAVMVPGGDPGSNDPVDLMQFLDDLAALLHSYFPEAELWVSNQGFEHEENDAFFEYLHNHQPEWLEGVVFGPWTKLGIQEERNRTPSQYPIRHYPDITHNVRCQYPQRTIDRSFAHLLNREAINPRPVANVVQHDVCAPDTIGFLTYSEGIHDDVNKVVWNLRGWDPSMSADAILLEYTRYFFGMDVAEDAKDGILALEENWTLPALTNTGVDDTFAQWMALEAAYPELESSWRWKLCLTRAYYDMYVRQKKIDEAAYEEQAYAYLSQADSAGSTTAMANASAELAKALTLSPTQQGRRTRILNLCHALWLDIGFQPSVQAPYLAKRLERGCIMDTIDMPTNDQPFLANMFSDAAALPTENERIAFLNRIRTWEDPGTGGFYDDLGDPERQPHLVQPLPWEEDPGRVDSAGQGFSWHDLDFGNLEKGGGRLTWQDQANTLFGQPLQMQYTGLDPVAGYRFKGTYFGRFKPTMTCTADGSYPIHGAVPYQIYPPREYAIPGAATRDGALNLHWDLISGRGCQLAETWLVVYDTDGDGTPDVDDADDDNDGIPDGSDVHPQDTDNDGVHNFDDEDNDGDTISDLQELSEGSDPMDPSDNIPALQVTPGNRDVAYTAGVTTFQVGNSGGGRLLWTASITSGESWASIQSGMSGTDDGTVTIAYTENPAGAPRTAEVSISAPGAVNAPMTVRLVQAVNTTLVLSVLPATQQVAADAGSCSFSVANMGGGLLDWSASVHTGAAWLSIVSGATGSGSGEIVVSFTANPTGMSRTASITVSVPGASNSPMNVSVVQACSLPGSPTGVTASNGSFTDRVRIAWEPVVGATRYNVYRNATADFASATLIGWQVVPLLDDTSAPGEGDPLGCSPNPVWYYWVTAQNDCGESAPSVPVQGQAGTGKALAETRNTFTRIGPALQFSDSDVHQNTLPYYYPLETTKRHLNNVQPGQPAHPSPMSQAGTGNLLVLGVVFLVLLLRRHHPAEAKE